ncbi:hypothetical protein L6452_37742 [Arctium lappa]|uniref:Uncharacterized protein n=1 Tax=Arctium lappa TaxID=4217 RepID=A0ACB8Y5A7_ARCLA|nr:hypothetical protein L6452_37742 [Arctium lappa]
MVASFALSTDDTPFDYVNLTEQVKGEFLPTDSEVTQNLINRERAVLPTIDTQYNFPLNFVDENDIGVGRGSKYCQQKNIQDIGNGEYLRIDHAHNHEVQGSIALPVFEDDSNERSCCTAELSTYTGDDDYILEFFLLVNMKGSTKQQLLLNKLSTLGGFDIGFERGLDESRLPVELSRSCSEQKYVEGSSTPTDQGVEGGWKFDPTTGGLVAAGYVIQDVDTQKSSMVSNNNPCDRTIDLAAEGASPHPPPSSSCFNSKNHTVKL